MEMNYYIAGALALILGYAMFLGMLMLLPRRLKAENIQQKQQIITEARVQAERVRQEALLRAQTKNKDAKEDLEAKMRSRQEDLAATEEELALQEEFLKREEARLQRLKKEIDDKRSKLEVVAADVARHQQAIKESNIQMISQLETQSGTECENLKKTLREDRITERQLESQKVLRFIEDDLSTNAKRMATRVLNRVQARYAPEFPWPKTTNHVEVTDRKALELLSREDSPLAQLKDLSEDVSIELMNDPENHGPPIVKLAGGFGVYREAARLTLDEILGSGGNWNAISQIYRKHAQALDRKALLLGQQACMELQLSDIHPEIMRMVGNLNWRTSYRQNQYLHTFEVAQLAGILASELGVDPDMAKRCGLLHDIGKTIDYRIEGSHAVISGDYADRYGESRIICDTVMSHHNDLVLETPLSYVLKAADTLSGARPGARVNLEEGYQIRLSAIDEVVRSFQGVTKVAIMNGGREVHVEFNHKRVQESELPGLSSEIARKIEEDVAYPGQIKVLVTRRFEAVAVA